MMINEIHVRTNKAEYNPGEDICGAVYLRIINPTAGRGIRASFCGYEQIEYEYKNEGREDQFVGYKESKDYINQNVVLHESKDPLTIGNTVYPFKIHLPVEIPGTFCTSGENEEVRWKALVEYVLEVCVIGASQMKVHEIVIILQPTYNIWPHCNSHSMPAAVHIAIPTRFLVFLKRNIHITGRLQNHIHRTGENMRLRVIVTNNSSVKVQSLKIQLLRKLILMSRRRTLSESMSDENVSGTDDRVFVCPEESSSVHKAQHIDMTHYPQGLDNIQIPLRNTDGTCIVPAVRGLFVKCEYTVSVGVTLSNTSSFDLNVPVTVIQAEKNKQWSQWKPPDWLNHEDFDIVHSDSVFGVPESVLSTESFSKIPGFQPL